MAHNEHFHSGPMAKPNLVNSNITYQTTGRELVLLQELQRQLWIEFDLQIAIDRAGVDTITAVFNEQYIKDKKEEYCEYAGETTLTLLAHFGTWYFITKDQRIDIKAIVYAPWSDSPNQHINTYACQMYRRQQNCATLRDNISNKAKVTHFV